MADKGISSLSAKKRLEDLKPINTKRQTLKVESYTTKPLERVASKRSQQFSHLLSDQIGRIRALKLERARAVTKAVTRSSIGIQVENSPSETLVDSYTETDSDLLNPGRGADYIRIKRESRNMENNDRLSTDLVRDIRPKSRSLSPRIPQIADRSRSVSPRSIVEKDESGVYSGPPPRRYGLSADEDPDQGGMLPTDIGISERASWKYRASKSPTVLQPKHDPAERWLDDRTDYVPSKPDRDPIDRRYDGTSRRGITHSPRNITESSPRTRIQDSFVGTVDDRSSGLSSSMPPETWETSKQDNTFSPRNIMETSQRTTIQDSSVGTIDDLSCDLSSPVPPRTWDTSKRMITRSPRNIMETSPTTPIQDSAVGTVDDQSSGLSSPIPPRTYGSQRRSTNRPPVYSSAQSDNPEDISKSGMEGLIHSKERRVKYDFSDEPTVPSYRKLLRTLNTSIKKTTDDQPNTVNLNELNDLIDQYEKLSVEKLRKREHRLANGMEYVNDHIDQMKERLLRQNKAADDPKERSKMITELETVKGMMGDISSLSSQVGRAKHGGQLIREVSETKYRLASLTNRATQQDITQHITQPDKSPKGVKDPKAKHWAAKLLSQGQRRVEELIRSTGIVIKEQGISPRQDEQSSSSSTELEVKEEYIEPKARTGLPVNMIPNAASSEGFIFSHQASPSMNADHDEDAEEEPELLSSIKKRLTTFMEWITPKIKAFLTLTIKLMNEVLHYIFVNAPFFLGQALLLLIAILLFLMVFLLMALVFENPFGGLFKWIPPVYSTPVLPDYGVHCEDKETHTGFGHYELHNAMRNALESLFPHAVGIIHHDIPPY